VGLLCTLFYTSYFILDHYWFANSLFHVTLLKQKVVTCMGSGH
jgi:hypothetical protein